MDPTLSNERNLPDNRKFGRIEYRLSRVQNAVEQCAINGKVECLNFIHKAMEVWQQMHFKDFTPEKKQRIAEILDEASGTIEKGTPIHQQIRNIIQLLLPPQFVSLCNDILELWMNSGNENEKIMNDLGLCVSAWREAGERGRRGMLRVVTLQKILAILMSVVDTLGKDVDMIGNTRLQYVVDFIKSVRTDLERRTTMKHPLRHPESVFTYVKAVLTTYAPPNAPPAVHVETVVEEGEEEEETAHDDSSLYLDIERKFWNVYTPLRESAENQTISANNGECFVFVQQAMDKWPGSVKLFTEGVRRDVAELLRQAQATVAMGSPIWLKLQEIIQLLEPPSVSGDAVRGGFMSYDDSGPVGTLLRQMKQLCA